MKNRLRGIGKAAAFALFVIALAAILLWILNQLAASTDERQQQAAQITALQSGMKEANARLAEQGEPPVPVPSVGPTEDPEEPLIILGERGPRGFTGATGAMGRRGPGPTQEQIDAAVDDWCNAGMCQGERGAKGAIGDTGAIGADGRGILSMQCATGGWAIDYTDGFTDTDAGPCQGPQGVHGEQGPASTVPGPKGDTGPQGTAKPGDYTCPDGEVMRGFSIAEDGAVTLACEDTTPPIIETP